ncbi:MAG: cache domain-containing protein [Desulfomonilaceae bacterium]
MRIVSFFGMCVVVFGMFVNTAYADMAEDSVSLVEKAEDTVSLVYKAVNLFIHQGSAAALKAINDSDGAFMKGEICVFAVTMDNVLVGHPCNGTVNQISLSNVQDSSGVPLFQKFKEIVEKDEAGWIEYHWGKPNEDLPFRKRFFVKKVPDQNFYVCAGYYLK